VPRIVRLTDGRTVINPGSVGLQAYNDLEPFNHATEVGAPHARYAVLTRRDGRWGVELFALAYDWDAAAAQARAHCRWWLHWRRNWMR